jgi:hypothetical protein
MLELLVSLVPAALVGDKLHIVTIVAINSA